MDTSTKRFTICKLVGDVGAFHPVAVATKSRKVAFAHSSVVLGSVLKKEGGREDREILR